MNLIEKFKFRAPHISGLIKPSRFLYKPVWYSSLELKFDKPHLIIDGGLHTLEANSKTFRALYPLLEDGGFFVIEDLTPESLIPLMAHVQMTIQEDKISIWGNPNKGLDNNLMIIGK